MDELERADSEFVDVLGFPTMLGNWQAGLLGYKKGNNASRRYDKFRLFFILFT